MTTYTIRSRILRTTLFLISAAFVAIPQANASDLDLSTECHDAAAAQAVASFRDEIKIQLEQSTQLFFPVDVNVEAAATGMDKVVKQTSAVASNELNEAS